MYCMAPRAWPSGPCGTYSTVILLNVKLTCSNISGEPERSPASIVNPVTRPCSIVTLRNSSCDLPALRCVSTALMMISFDLSADIKGVDALSTRLTILSSWVTALPLAEPPPRFGRACNPHVQLRTSISLP
ncbi:hypothetical protein D3C83_27740 [compost metagenome]